VGGTGPGHCGSRARTATTSAARGLGTARLTQLKQLGELLSAGVLTQAEFEQEKARILNG
jgi:hypothetical protein